MPESTEPPISREELLALFSKFREVKHGVGNAIAVLMALSEMAQRKPDQVERLCASVLTKGPIIIAGLQQFSEEFRALANPTGEDGPPSSTRIG